MPSARSTRRSARQPSAAAEPAAPALPPDVDPALLKAMSLVVPQRGRDHRLTGAEVERALLTGEHARTLELYFGESPYVELCGLAARAARRTRHAGPRVIILPGILGSMLAEVDGDDTDTLWVDIGEIMIGRLRRLKLPETARRYRAVDVHRSSYLKLKLWLRAEGFDADFHPFDWRRSIPDLGRELAARLAAEPATEIKLVAHSMGGLVARAALHHGAGGKVARLVMLGTPNYGSFAPALVYRSAYPFLHKIAALDLRHDATELAGEVFNTHPGLAQMLPQREKFGAIDLYDIEAWPRTGARPLAELIAAAPAAQRQFAVVPEKFTMIAGVDRETVVGARVAGGEFVFERSRDGDGTVPLDFAVLPDVQTYYVAEDHSALPQNPAVHRAVADILRTGATAQLPDRWERSRSGPRTEIAESALREQAAGPARRQARDFGAADFRGLIAEFAAPASTAPAPAANPAQGAPDLAPWTRLSVGRRRQRHLDVHLARGSLIDVRSRAYLLGVFQNVAPGGAVRELDAEMDGTFTEFRQRRMFSAGAGEVLLVPRGRSRIPADHVVFVGLGHFDRFNLQVLETAAENVARTLARAGIEEFATVPIGAGTGFDVEAALQALLRGFFRGLDDVDPRHAFRAVTFCELDAGRFDTLKQTLYRLWSTPLCEGVEATFDEIALPPPAPRRTGGVRQMPCVYLNVRARRDAGRLTFESSLLTTGAKATVLSGSVQVPAAQLAKHLARIESETFTFAGLGAFGTELAGLVLDDTVAAGLAGCADSHVVVVHDADASRVPWETLCLGGAFPALAGGMSRRYLAENLSVAKWLERRREDAWLDVLLVVNPTLDLAGAQAEGARIRALFDAGQHVRLTVVEGAAATRARLRREFASGKYDILHYAGHAYFDAQQTARSGVVCADGELTGAELIEIGNLPSLVFFNACESARIRKHVRRESPRVSRDLNERIERTAGLAEAFMRGGVANYLGTYWPVGDDSAKAFAETFYRHLLRGEPLSAALAVARTEVAKLKSPDWADYLFYGSLDFTVKTHVGG